MYVLEGAVHVVNVDAGKILRNLAGHKEIEHFEEFILGVIFATIASRIDENAEGLMP